MHVGDFFPDICIMAKRYGAQEALEIILQMKGGDKQTNAGDMSQLSTGSDDDEQIRAKICLPTLK